MSAQRALRGLEAEMSKLLGGTEENGAIIINVIYLPCRQMIILQRLKRENNLVA